MHILHVLGELRMSGAERMLQTAAQSFNDEGVTFDVLSTGETEGVAASDLAKFANRVDHVPFRKHPQFFLRVGQIIREGHYDVIHVHTERASWWLALTCRLAGTSAIVRTVHSSFQFEGWLRVRRTLQRRVLAGMGIVFAVPGTSVAENERERFGVSCQVIPNWVDPSVADALDASVRVAARSHYHLAPSELVVVSVGNCGPAKRHPTLLRALATLAEEGLELTYLHAGEEEPGYPEQRLAIELGLDRKVRFLGPVQDVTGLLAAADVFVMPSAYEGFGVAAVEALVAGLPMVLADVSGLRDLRTTFAEIEWGENSVGSFVDAIRVAVAKAPSFRDGPGRSQSERARQMFSPEQGASAYARMYRQALGTN